MVCPDHFANIRGICLDRAPIHFWQWAGTRDVCSVNKGGAGMTQPRPIVLKSAVSELSEGKRNEMGPGRLVSYLVVF